VTLKLKTAGFKTRTRNTTLAEPTALASRMFDAARPLLQREADGKTQFRLIGVGISHLSPLEEGAPAGGLDQRAASQARAELAMDKLREKFGAQAIEKGRGISVSTPPKSKSD
jgi:DNA polymerase-4